MTIRDRDNGYKALLEKAKKLSEGKPFVEVGILATEGDAEKGPGLTLFEVAEQHEFGFGVPERSFIRAFFDENEDEVRKMLVKHMPDTLGKSDKKEVMHKLGIWLVAKCQTRIRAHIEPALSPMTVQLKGSSTPLIDTGQLWTSISYRTSEGEEVRPSVRGGAKGGAPKAKGGAPKGKGGNGRDERGRFLPKGKK